MRQIAIPPPSPIFAVDGRLIVVRGGGSDRGCTIVTALALPRNTEILPPSGHSERSRGDGGGTCMPPPALRRKAVKEGRRSQQPEAL
jgi:hypothetical protein